MTMNLSSSYTNTHAYIHMYSCWGKMCAIHREVDGTKVEFSALLKTLLTRFSDRQESLVVREKKKFLCVRLSMHVCIGVCKCPETGKCLHLFD